MKNNTKTEEGFFQNKVREFCSSNFVTAVSENSITYILKDLECVFRTSEGHGWLRMRDECG